MRISDAADVPKPGLFRPTFLIILTLLFNLGATASKTPDVQKAEVENSRQLVKQADKLIKKGNVIEAEKLLLRAVNVAGEDSFPKLRLAQLYVKLRRLTEAYDICYPIAAAEPKNAYAYAVLGSTMLGVGRFKDARGLFFTALKMDRKQALAWAGFGMLEFYENRIPQSLNNLEEAVFQDPEQPDYVFALAQVSARAEKYKVAADAYYRFLAVSKDTDDERRARIKGLINFLNFLGQRQSLYSTAGAVKTSVPIVLTGNRPVIQLRINNRDEPLNFVLDTGSGISVISD
ncbi:MAG: tetratricopeptide repeat protein, partial [Acidobacteria bacterium]|nr:tetratricopeptide repeat protein [Acidobacteriota bacterium]